MYALDAESGEETWAFETGYQVWSSPTVDNGSVFVGSGDGTLYALDAEEEGSSEDTRVNLGTLGHHDEWAGLAGPIERSVDDDGSGFGPVAGLVGLGGAAYLAARRRADNRG